MSLKEEAGVLLISSEVKDYLEMKDYGFKNIDHFRSLVRADRYFQKHPEELKKYHLIITGKRSISGCQMRRELELEKTLRHLQKTTDAFVTKISRITRGEEHVLETHLYDRHVLMDQYVDSRTHEGIFDVIVKHMQSQGTLRKSGYRGTFKPIDYLHSLERIPEPTKKSEIKILCFVNYVSPEEMKKVLETTKSMGLNVTFVDENNYSLGENVGELGSYDIVIASDMFSKVLLDMEVESTEQCKDTGRNTTLLATYDCKESYVTGEDRNVSRDTGSNIKLEYLYAGPSAPHNHRQAVEFGVLGKAKEAIPAIISASVQAYEKALIKPLTDLDLKTPDEYDKEHKEFVKIMKNKVKKELAPVKAFDSMYSNVIMYMDYVKKGLIKRDKKDNKTTKEANGLSIYRSGNVLILRFHHHGRVIYTLRTPVSHDLDNLRFVSIKIGDGDYKRVTLRTKKYNTWILPPKASRKDLEIISGFEELVNKTLHPLIMKAIREEGMREQMKTIRKYS